MNTSETKLSEPQNSISDSLIDGAENRHGQDLIAAG